MDKNIMEIKKERTTGELINDTFAFVLQNFVGLYKPILLFASPSALISAFFYSKLQLSLLTNQEYGNTTINNIIYITTLVVANVLLYGVVYGYVYFHIKEGKNKFSIDDIGTYMKHYMGKISAALLFMITFIVIGLFLFIVPGIYLCIPLLFLVAVLLFEGLDFQMAFLRCLLLIKGKWWSTFGMFLLINAIVLVFGLIIKIPEFIYTLLLKTNLNKQVTSLPLQFSIAATTTQFLVFFLQIFPIVFIILQYFNINESRIKKETPTTIGNEVL
jgi:hypothetical protein